MRSKRVRRPIQSHRNINHRQAVAERMEPRTLMSTYVVNTTSDTPAAGFTTLRQAVADANAHAGADTISFSSSVFTTGSLHTIKLTGGQISFTDKTGATTISGPGPAVVAVSGNANGRVFNVGSGVTVSLNGIQVTDGSVHSSTTSGQGGAIFSAGNLTVSGSTVSNSTTYGGVTGGNGDAGQGGGIYSTGTLTISGTTIKGNTAMGGDADFNTDNNGSAYGGGIYTTGTTNISNSTIQSNTGTVAQADNAQDGSVFGGGIYASGSLSLTSVWLDSNTAKAFSRSDPSDYSSGFAGDAFGGGVYATQSVVVNTSTVSGNSAVGGSAFYSNAGLGSGGGIFDNGSGSVTVTNSTVSGNSATGGSGEIADDGSGGGIYSGVLTVSSSSLYNNTATGGSGDNVDGETPGPKGAQGFGGAIYANLKLAMTDSTVANNTAVGGKGGPGENDDGSAYLAGGAGGKAMGGGIDSYDGFVLSSDTITGNTANGGTGATGGSGDPNGANGTATGNGVAIFGGGTSLANNTIISANKGGSTDVSGSLSSSSSHNLIGTGGGLTNGSNGNKVGVTNPDLSSLGYYGGNTETMPPISGSPAINAGSVAALPSGLTLDQRGYPRFSGTILDIGSVEVGKGSIAGVVFNDINANGTKDSGENGLSGIKLFLDLNVNGLPDTGEPVVTTSSTGAFSFTALPAGSYRIWEETPTGYRVDSPAVFFSEVVVKDGQAVTGVNFADTQKILISGTVFNDTNGNGVQNTGETAASGWRVYVDLTDSGTYKSTDPSVVTTSTGAWSFSTLAAGTYYIRIVPQAGKTTTTPSLGYFKFTVGAGGIRANNLFGEHA